MELVDVVKKLVGPVRGVGETNADKFRLESMKTLCDLIDDLLLEVRKASNDSDSHMDSVKSIGLYARDFINDIEG